MISEKCLKCNNLTFFTKHTKKKVLSKKGNNPAPIPQVQGDKAVQKFHFHNINTTVLRSNNRKEAILIKFYDKIWFYE